MIATGPVGRRRAFARGLAAALSASLVLAGCATIPREREPGPEVKPAASDAQIGAVLERYAQVRRTAASLLDPKPLSTVESDAVLLIDTGSFELTQRLGGAQPAAQGAPRPRETATPRFGEYPLWFMVEVPDAVSGVNRVQVFERERASDPWFLVASPETVASTTLPELRRRDGHALAIAPDSATGMAMSAQDAADAYAAALMPDGPDAGAATSIEDDDFLAQMRAAAQQNAALEGVDFSQSWSARPVQHVLRTADGGVLAFVTLERVDTYTVQQEGRQVAWPEGSPQRAFLGGAVTDTATLTYLHQLLVHVPGGEARPRALGQYGGVVDADGT